MEIVIQDNIRFLPYKYENENELEDLFFKNFKYIFGDGSILFTKRKLKTISGIGTIPDAFVISLDKKKWFIIEVELSIHPLYEHIVPQLSKFNSALNNFETKRALSNSFFGDIQADIFKQALVKQKVIDETYKYLSELIDTKPELIIIIDKKTSELEAVCNDLNFKTKVLEFKTYHRENLKNEVLIHKFDTIVENNKIFEKVKSPIVEQQIKIPSQDTGSNFDKVTIVDLINSGVLKQDTVIFRYFKGEKIAGTVLKNGTFRLEDGSIYKSIAQAGKRISNSSENAWITWYAIDEKGEARKLDYFRGRFENRERF